MSPPPAARIVLAMLTGDADAEFVAGDLEEEFAQICACRGPRAGRRWYRSQVARSAVPLLQLRIRSGDLTDIFLSAFLGVALPLILLDRLWQFVYSQIPFKDGLDRALGLLAINAACLLVGAAIGGWHARTAPRATWGAMAAAAFAAVALYAAPESTPLAYVAAVLFAAPAASIFPFVWRRSR